MRIWAAAILTSAALFAGCSPAKVDYCTFGERDVLVFVDETTAFDDVDENRVRLMLGAVADGLGPGDRVTLRTIGEHYSTAATVFDRCNPWCISTNPLDEYLGSGCGAMRARRDAVVFKQDLFAVALDLTENPRGGERSDIVSTIARTTLSMPSERSYEEIIIHSDMLENSVFMPWSEFSATPPAELLATVRTASLLPRVDHATVRIVGVGRLHSADRRGLQHEQDENLRTFWEQYFLAGGARRVIFDSVETR